MMNLKILVNVSILIFSDTINTLKISYKSYLLSQFVNKDRLRSKSKTACLFFLKSCLGQPGSSAEAAEHSHEKLSEIKFLPEK